MKDISFFVSLLKLLDETAELLNLDHLTDANKIVLQMLWLAAEQKRNNVFKMSYQKLKNLIGNDGPSISRAQFYKTIQSLEDRFHQSHQRRKKWAVCLQLNGVFR